MLKTMRMIQQAAPIPAMKAGCLTTSEICCDRGFCGLAMPSVILPDASVEEQVQGAGLNRSGAGKVKKYIHILEEGMNRNEEGMKGRGWGEHFVVRELDGTQQRGNKK